MANVARFSCRMNTGESKVKFLKTVGLETRKIRNLDSIAR